MDLDGIIHPDFVFVDACVETGFAKFLSNVFGGLAVLRVYRPCAVPPINVFKCCSARAASGTRRKRCSNRSRSSHCETREFAHCPGWAVTPVVVQKKLETEGGQDRTEAKARCMISPLAGINLEERGGARRPLHSNAKASYRSGASAAGRDRAQKPRPRIAIADVTNRSPAETKISRTHDVNVCECISASELIYN